MATLTTPQAPPTRAEPSKHPAHVASDHVFNLGVAKAYAWDAAQRVAEYAGRTMAEAGYAGPLAVAGGYVRDIALGRIPKDLDLFIDVDMSGGIEHTSQLAMAVARAFDGIGDVAAVVTPIQCYGTWADDVAHVVKIDWEKSPGMEDLDGLRMVGALAVPFGFDLIALDRAELLRRGYVPGHASSFLKAVCSRLDIRINAIGASPGATYEATPGWNEDVMEKRLVVQFSRGNGETDERQRRRLDKFAGPGGKYEGWSIWNEQADGSLEPCS